VASHVQPDEEEIEDEEGPGEDGPDIRKHGTLKAARGEGVVVN